MRPLFFALLAVSSQAEQLFLVDGITPTMVITDNTISDSVSGKNACPTPNDGKCFFSFGVSLYNNPHTGQSISAYDLFVRTVVTSPNGVEIIETETFILSDPAWTTAGGQIDGLFIHRQFNATDPPSRDLIYRTSAAAYGPIDYEASYFITVTTTP